MMRHLGIAILLLGLLAPSSPAAEVEEADTDYPPFCGLYALYAAARIEGRPVNAFNDLLTPRYLGSPDGSSARELVLAAQEHGLHASVMTGLTRLDLVRSPGPVILHVKSSVEATEADHWLLWVPRTGGGIVIDGTRQRPDKSLADVAAYWNGVGIVVSAEPISAGFRGWQFLLYGGLASGLAIAGAAVSLGRHRRATEQDVVRSAGTAGRSAFIGMGAICGGAVALGASHILLDGLALARRTADVAAIQRSHLGQFLPQVSSQEVLAATSAGDSGRTLIVDARHDRDYLRSHIPDAVNLTPFSTNDDIRSTLGAPDATRRIIIYCQSAGCPYSDHLAARLLDLGYGQLHIFRGGFQVWKAGEHPVAIPPEAVTP